MNRVRSVTRSPSCFFPNTFKIYRVDVDNGEETWILHLYSPVGTYDRSQELKTGNVLTEYPVLLYHGCNQTHSVMVGHLTNRERKHLHSYLQRVSRMDRR